MLAKEEFRTELSTARAALGSGRVRIKDPKTGKYKVYKKESLLGQVIQAEDKEKGIKEKVVSLFEFRNMSTNDIAKLRKEEIKKFYHQLTDGGMKAKDAKKEIAAFYFGS